MKHFIYTYNEKDRRHNGVWRSHKTVRIFRVVRNEPTFVAEMTETYVSEFQLVMMCAEANKLLPKRAFERHPGGSYKYGQAYLLKEAGIASFTRI